MILRRVGFFAVFAGIPGILALASCSGASPCERMQYALIARLSRCSETSISDAEVKAQSARIPLACKAQLGVSGTTGLADLQGQCAFDLDNATCGGLPPSCTSFVGSLTMPQPCGSDIQCKSGSCGLTKPMGLPPYCGNCQDRAPEMGGCAVSSDCQPGLLCKSYIDQITMLPAGICAKALGGVGDPCLVQRDCRGPNHCDGTGKCAAPVKKNEPCAARSDCDFGLVCSGRCTTAIGLNGTCTGGDCDKDLACNPKTHLCAKVTYAAPGQPCDGVLGLCTRGVCTKGACLGIIPDGQACDPTNAMAVCDAFAKCVDGTCLIPEPKKCGSPAGG